MKKKVLFVAALFVAATTFAQDGLTSKKGETILPEAGDWALGFDANPFLTYAGQMFNGTTSNNFGGATWTNPAWAIYGKMFKDENTAYRAMVRIGFGSSTVKNSTDTSGLFTTGVVDDEASSSNFNIVLGGGIEKRRGSTRIQGIYGAEGYLMFGSSSTSYTYGDSYDDNHTATWTDNFTAGSTSTATTRTTEMKNGGTFGFGLRGFIGVEWFVAPKVSIAAEYGWGLGLSSTGDSEVTTERWGLASAAATTNSLNTETVTLTDGGSSSFSLDTDVSNASLRIMFHF